MTATTANQGAGSAGPFTVRVYLSTDDVFDAGDLEVGSQVMAAWRPAHRARAGISATIPAGMSGSFC